MHNIEQFKQLFLFTGQCFFYFSGNHINLRKSFSVELCEQLHTPLFLSKYQFEASQIFFPVGLSCMEGINCANNVKIFVIENCLIPECNRI